jgi:hypothetical protein
VWRSRLPGRASSTSLALSRSRTPRDVVDWDQSVEEPPTNAGRPDGRVVPVIKQPQRQHDRYFASRKRQRHQRLAIGGLVLAPKHTAERHPPNAHPSWESRYRRSPAQHRCRRRAYPLEQAVLSWTKRVRKAVHKLIHAGRYSAAHVEKADEKFGVVSEAVRPVSR